MSVDLPEPLGPMMATIFPRGIVRRIPLRTSFAPKDFQRSTTSITDQIPTEMKVIT